MEKKWPETAEERRQRTNGTRHPKRILAMQGNLPPLNLFAAIHQLGHDLDFDPATNIRSGRVPKPKPTDAAPGSDEKIKVMATRVLLGQPIHVEGDRIDCEGMDAALQGPWLFTTTGPRPMFVKREIPDPMHDRPLQGNEYDEV
jgi:hypothetical protein